MINNTFEKVKSKVVSAEKNSIFSAADFLDFGDRIIINRALSKLEHIGVIERIAKGIYIKTTKTRFGILYPSTDTIVESIAKRDKAQILPTGLTALNNLGLSTQIPMQSEYITSGSARTIDLGKSKIKLLHRSPKNFAYRGEVIPIIILAFQALGKDNVEPNHIERVRAIIQKHPEYDTILHDLALAPKWIEKIIKPLIVK